MFTAKEIYIITLIVVSIVGGLINTFQFINYVKQSKSRFLSSRNPPLIILYCLISLFTALIISPLDLYKELHNSLHATQIPFFARFSAAFLQEMCSIALLLVISSRAWLLFYDYKFSQSSSDAVWRMTLNQSDNSFWLKHRKTFGNVNFIICLTLICMSFSLLFLSAIGNLALQQENEYIFHYFSLFALGIPLWLFIIYLVYNKIQIINDVYLIHKELKLLSICIILRIFAFAMDTFILHKYDYYLFHYSFEVITTFASVWIQCWWVLNQLKKNEEQKDSDMYVGMNSVERHSNSGKNKNFLRLIDIFEEQTSFEIFIRHCAHELSIESILFLIEISQFKATLLKYNACGIDEIKFRFLDQNRTNIIKYIKNKREEEINTKLVFHPLYETSSPVSPQLQFSNASNKSKSENADCIIDLKNLKRFDARTVAAPKQESEYMHFQQNILSKKWLPLNKLLLDIKGCEYSNKENTEKSKTKSGTHTLTGNKMSELTKTKSLSSHASTATPTLNTKKNNLAHHITPISLAVVNDSEQSPSPHSAMSPQSDSQSIPKNMTVDVHWMYEYGRYLYQKYVNDTANLSINVSHTTRKDLWSVYSKDSSEEAFQRIFLIHHESLSSISHLTQKEEQRFLQTYLYHSFDGAFNAVWGLLKSDTFYRFQKSTEYKQLCVITSQEKIEKAKALREDEYSRSYKDTVLDDL